MNKHVMSQQDTMILLVDNHPQKQSELEADYAKLNVPGYSLVKVHSFVDGFRQLLEQNFELILLRLLPGACTDAVDLIQRLAQFHDISVLIL